MDTPEKTLVKLLNPKFVFSFADKDYEIRKANISQFQRYQTRLTELLKDETTPVAARDFELLAFAIYLVLSKDNNDITLDFVRENIPGNVDVLLISEQLGFIDPRKAELIRKLQEKLLSITESSSEQSPIVPDGFPKKSENSPSTS